VPLSILVPPNRHWQANGPVPAGVTANVAAAPAATVIFVGWLIMTGGAVMVSVVIRLVTAPATFAATTV